MRVLASFLLLASLPLLAVEYPLTRDSEPHPGVPEGKIEHFTWTSKIFPGTERGVWIYVPAQYKASEPAAVMVFQDGGRMHQTEGANAWRTPIVLDNLIHEKAMPVTIGIFIDPGVMPALKEDERERYNRSYEYDGMGDRYARFLIEEILPEVGRKYNLTDDPNLRGIGGSSSGGIAAFTAAWERPDTFRRVLMFVGSFTNLR
ncbi:MAG: alpha/beta hydrolase-fold protein, partial [Bryobacterales bacterium]